MFKEKETHIVHIHSTVNNSYECIAFPDLEEAKNWITLVNDMIESGIERHLNQHTVFHIAQSI